MASDAPTVQPILLSHIAHVYYKHARSTIEAARTFMLDFGFIELPRTPGSPFTYYRGYGPEPFAICLEETESDTSFGGAAFAVDSEAELIRASEVLPPECRPTKPYTMKDAPGQGMCVTFYDPVDGFPFHIVWGQQTVDLIDPTFPDLKINYVRFDSPSCRGIYISTGNALAARISPLFAFSGGSLLTCLCSRASRTGPPTSFSASRKDRRQCTNSATLACA
jgi:hypothetical protein